MSKTHEESKMVPVKKRGVYVEKQGIDNVSSTPKAPRRSKPGTKKFVASVLTILSQNTTGTQYPPDTPDETTEPQKNEKTKLKQKHSSKIFKSHSKTDIKPKNPEPKRPKKQKYRSRVLNVLNYDPEKTLVLKPKREIIQTPSNYSKSTKDETVSNQSIKWAEFLPKLIDSETGAVKKTPDEKLATCVREGTESKPNETETPKISNAPEKDEKLYKIFVNLLETMHTDDAPIANDAVEETASIKTEKSSKVHFDIEDPDVTKLYAPLDTRNFDNAHEKFYPSGYDETVERNKRQLADYYSTQPLMVQYSDPDIYEDKPVRSVKKKAKISKSHPRTPDEPKRKRKKAKNPNFLTVLKAELSMDRRSAEPPDNFFHSLRAMARNKRITQKSIHFDIPNDEDVDYDRRCCFKRPIVMSPSRRSPKPEKFTEIPPGLVKKPRYPASTVSGSVHSLEVFGFDYDAQKQTDSDFSDEEILTVSGEDMVCNWNRGFKTTTQVCKQ